MTPSAIPGHIAWIATVERRPDVSIERLQVKVVFVVPGSEIVWLGMYSHRWPDQPADESAWASYNSDSDRYVIWDGPEPCFWAYALSPAEQPKAGSP